MIAGITSIGLTLTLNALTTKPDTSVALLDNLENA